MPRHSAASPPPHGPPQDAQLSALIDSAPMSPSLRALARRGVLRSVRKGTELISEGELGDTLFIVLRGQLRAYGVGADGTQVTYGTYGAGAYVGEMALDGGPRSANVGAMTPTLCVTITRQTLLEHLTAEPQFAFELLAKVIQVARQATIGLKRMALNGVYGRLKELLDSLAVPQADRTWLVDPAPSHQEMAEMLGCGRSMVSRVMKALERGGWVEVGRRRVVIRKSLPAKW